MEMIDITPTWETAARIYLSPEVPTDDGRQELITACRELDRLQALQKVNA